MKRAAILSLYGTNRSDTSSAPLKLLRARQGERRHMITRLFARRLFLLWVFSLVPFVNTCAQYHHKSESEIAALTPAQRVDEYANEQAFHKYDVLDQQRALISKYILRDGLRALPRMVEIIDEYDPTRESGRIDHRGERFDAMWMLLSDLDRAAVRLRASPEGLKAMDALARAIDRMRAAGYGKKDQHEWAEHGRFDSAVTALDDTKGIDDTDEAIRDTLWVKYKLKMSDKDLLAFSNFLIARDPGYPAWSETYDIKDYSRVNAAGNPAQVYIMKESDRFYEAYLQFKKQRL